jgi:hypothetical protein
MVKKIFVFALVLAMSASMAVVKFDKANTKTEKRINDTGSFQQKGITWAGTMGTTFDKGSNGAGWYQGYNRKIQTNMDPVTGPMIGSVYRQLSAIGTGVVGGMVGSWGATFSGFSQSIYESSEYQGNPYGTGIPGGRYPYTCEFINGYVFGIFNDYNLPVGSSDSQAMFTVGDATYGWEESYWSAPARAEAVESGATPPGVWTGIGDVVYNPADGYYYWAHNWIYDLTSIDTYTYCMTGRSNNPVDPTTWEWTDYHELTFDTTTDPNDILQMNDLSVAYCKDIYGNGTGYGIAVAAFTDKEAVTNAAGDTLDVIDHPKLGYMYTTNWGADWSTGDFKSNWITPNNEGTNLFTADINKLFSWYNQDVSLDETTTVPLNWPVVLWNISSIATEENYVHVMLKVVGGSTEAPDYWFRLSDEQVVGGYYDVVGKITDSGVEWISANLIGNWMGVWDDTEEFKYSNSHDFAIGYAGKGAVYASWLDRPESRYQLVTDVYPDFTNCNKDYIVDAFVTYSPDHGRTWDINKTVVMTDSTYTPPVNYTFNYAKNITNGANLMDQGFTVASHGVNAAGTITFYGVCQYFDLANPSAPPLDDFSAYQQFYKAWRIIGTGTGIETEEVSMVKDFVLEQNYPNPFNPATEIRFGLQNDSNVKLSVYNTKGELVANLKNGKMAKGAHKVSFDASALNSGVYFYKLDVNGMAETRKMVLTK